MIEREDRAAILVTLIAIAFVGLALLYRAPRAAVLSPTTQALADSINRTKPSHDSAVVARARVDSLRVRNDARMAAAVRASQARADAVGRRADSLAAAAAVADDNADAWKAAHDARLAEVRAQRATTDSLQRRADSLELANNDLRHERDSIFKPRIAGLERLNASILADLRKINECRILPGVPCPSRTQAAVASLVVGSVGVLLLVGAR